MFYNVESAARCDSDKTAIQYFGTAITYGSLLEQVKRMAGYLQHDGGVTPGDRVVLCRQNCQQYLMACHARSCARTNPMWRAAEFERVVRYSGACVAFIARRS